MEDGSRPRFGEPWDPRTTTVTRGGLRFVDLQNLTETVEVIIGNDNDQSRWVVHREIFENNSKFVRALFQKPSDKDKQPIQLPDEETAIFAEYVKFLYTGFISCISLDKLVKMYVLGSRLHASNFMDGCYNTLKSADSFMAQYSVGTIKYAYDNISSGDKLRQLMTEQIGKGVLAKLYRWDMEERKLLSEHLPELVGGITTAISQQAINRQFGQSGPSQNQIGTFVQPPLSTATDRQPLGPANAGSTLGSDGVSNGSSGTFGSVFPSRNKPQIDSNTMSTSLLAQTGRPAAGDTGFFAIGGNKDPDPTPPAQGTLDPVFAPVANVEPNGWISNYQSISMMAPYSKHSNEELRQADYNAGRKFGTSTIGGAGLFGSSSCGTSGQHGGLFGAKINAVPAQSTSVLFNNPNNLRDQGAFSQLRGGSGYGYSNPQPTNGVLFGNSNAQQNVGGFGQSREGLFGNLNLQQKAGGFGQPTAFSLCGNRNPSPFGGPTLQVGPQNGGGLSSNSSSSQIGGLFGSKNATQPSGGGASANLNAPQGSGDFGQSSRGLFGSPTHSQSCGLFASTHTAKSSGGLFGAQQPPQPAQPSSGNSLFGKQQFSSSPAPSGSLLDTKQPMHSLFSSLPSSGGPFNHQPSANAQSYVSPFARPNICACPQQTPSMDKQSYVSPNAQPNTQKSGVDGWRFPTQTPNTNTQSYVSPFAQSIHQRFVGTVPAAAVIAQQSAIQQPNNGNVLPDTSNFADSKDTSASTSATTHTKAEDASTKTNNDDDLVSGVDNGASSATAPVSAQQLADEASESIETQPAPTAGQPETSLTTAPQARIEDENEDGFTIVQLPTPGE